MRFGIKYSEYKLAVSLLVLGLVGCNIAATRPIQEMSNADIALRAAKDLNADSLVPELYRSAGDHYFKAKRDYRLKEFDSAKMHALKAMKLAEQAEFEAYKLGGATPEASSRLSSPEGSSADPDAAFKTSAPPPADDVLTSPTQEPARHSTPAHTEPAEKGQDYESYLKQQEAEKEKAEKEKEKAEKAEKPKEEKKPEGPLGPQGPGGAPTPTQQKFNPVTTFPDRAAPSTGFVPPTMGGGLNAVKPFQAGTPDLNPYQGSDLLYQQLEDPVAVPKTIPALEAKPIPELGSNPEGKENRFPQLGEDDIPYKEGLSPLPDHPLPLVGGDKKEDEK